PVLARLSNHQCLLASVSVDQLVWGSGSNYLSVIDDGHCVCYVLGLIHVVSCEEDRLPLFLQSFYDIPNIAPSSRIQTSGRLVQEDQSRIVDQRDRETDPLFQSAGESLELFVPLIFQVDQLDKL